MIGTDYNEKSFIFLYFSQSMQLTSVFQVLCSNLCPGSHQNSTALIPLMTHRQKSWLAFFFRNDVIHQGTRRAFTYDLKK